MKRLLGMIALLGLALVAADAALGVERFPPPDFTDHELPETQLVPSRPAWREYLDLAALTVGIGLASYFALVSRWRRGLFGLAIIALVWFGFWRQGCVCSIGATQNVSLALFDHSYHIPVFVVGFFVLPLVFTLFFGRTFCAAICPLGAIQEVAVLRPIRVPNWLEHALGLIPWIYLGAAALVAATGTAFLICRYDPFVGFFRLSAPENMLIFGGALLVIGAFVGRPYCRFLCPYGALLGLCSRVSRWHAKIPPEECIQCRLCEDACPYNAIQEPTVAQTPQERARGRRRLVGLLVLAPVLIAGGAVLGGWLQGPLSRLDPQVRLAERLRLEETDQVEGTTDETDAFRNTGRPASELYQEAATSRAQFGTLGTWLGAWVGLVVGVKLIHLSIRRRRDDYRPDPSRCVSCGRCYWYCPGEQARQGWIEDASAYAPAEQER
jgi:ferredoxin